MPLTSEFTKGLMSWNYNLDEAPKDGSSVLMWCQSAESNEGAQEMHWSENRWRYVIYHPYPNACPNPVAWMIVVPPEARE